MARKPRNADQQAEAEIRMANFALFMLKLLLFLSFLLGAVFILLPLAFWLIVGAS